MSTICMIGGGSWGTALAWLLAEKGHAVSLWVFEDELAEEIRNTRMNSMYLPGLELPGNIGVSHRFDPALKDAEFLISAVPTQYTRGVFQNIVPLLHKDTRILSASKGIENRSLMTVSAVIKEMTGHEAAVLSGPSFARDVVRKLPTAVTAAGIDEGVAKTFQDLFSTEFFRVYTSSDVLGVELGGALKNVMAIAAGISDGLGLGPSSRAALITRGLAEIIRLGTAMGAQEKTFSGLSGMGDLVLTCTSETSRNYSVGVQLGRGEKLRSILDSMTMVAEGVDTADSAYELSKKHGIDMPVVEQVYKTLREELDPSEAVRCLMARRLRSEN